MGEDAGGVGHRHELGVTEGGDPTLEFQASADQLLADTRAGTARYQGIGAALADGYMRNPQAMPGQPTAHDPNPRYRQDDAILDPTKPESLVYADPDGRPHSGDEILLGVVFTTPRRVAGPQIGGPRTVWHTHAEACATDPEPACQQAGEKMHVWTHADAVYPFVDFARQAFGGNLPGIAMGARAAMTGTEADAGRPMAPIPPGVSITSRRPRR